MLEGRSSDRRYTRVEMPLGEVTTTPYLTRANSVLSLMMGRSAI